MEEKEHIQRKAPSRKSMQGGIEEENSSRPNKHKRENKPTHQLEDMKENPSQLQNRVIPLPKQDRALLVAEPHEDGGGENETKLKNHLVISPQQKTKVVASKQSQKGKHTVPQPFSLATEKRMSKERRGGALESAPSSNLKVERTITERPAATRPILKSSERAEKKPKASQKTKDKVETTEAQAKRPRLAEKARRSIDGEAEVKSMRKSYTFKATPLPSFYHKKAPPSLPELKKIPSTRPKSPLLHRRSKSISEPLRRAEMINRSKTIPEGINIKTEPSKRNSASELGNGKTEQINRSLSVLENGSVKPEPLITRSKSVSETITAKPEASNRTSSKAPNGVPAASEPRNAKTAMSGKSSTRSISSTAKEAINKLLRGSWKAPKTVQSKELPAKSRKPFSNSGLEKGVAKGVLVA